MIAEEPKVDSVADTPTVINFIDSGSSNSSSTYCVHRYFGPGNCWNNSNANANSNGSISSGISKSNDDNGLIQMQPDNIIGNVKSKIIC